MKMHADARLSLKGRELLVDRVENAGWSLMSAAAAAGISDRTARTWVARHRAEGPKGCWNAPQPRRLSPTAPRSTESRSSRRCAGCV